MPASSEFSRGSMLARLDAETFDVLVIGGGITGVGVALDAVSRGLKTALVERDDFASGTSSKSSKMVHGGFRYLQQGDVRLVYEALHERRRLMRNAPHLVTLLPFMIPILTKDGVVSRKIARAMGSAMWMYDLTGGWRIGKLHKRLKPDKALAHMPTMNRQRLASAYLYYDAGADDARLCLTVARTAADQGAVVANRCGVVELLKDSAGKAAGAIVDADGRRITVRARAVVNAAGVWSDDVRSLDEGTHPDSIRPAKGVHVTIPWHFARNDIAVIIPVAKDKRSLFLVPWGPNADGTFKYTYVGTTDTDWAGPLDDPQCTKDDIDYVLRALNAALASSLATPVTEDDITGVWAGLRPLVKGVGVKSAASGRTADLSRRHSVRRSDSGVVTVTGGKLTTYREMAQATIDEVLQLLSAKGRCRTKRLALRGANGYRAAAPGTAADHLGGRYGSLLTEVQALIDADASLTEPLVPGLPYLRAEAVYAVQHEMACTLDDVLSRRTRALLFDRPAALAAAPAVAALIAPHLGWDSATTATQVAHFRDLCAAEVAAGLVPEAELIGSLS